MKRIKQLYIAAVSVVTALSMSSCNDWLDLYPSDAVPADDAITSSEDVASARVGMYAALKGNGNLVDYYASCSFMATCAARTFNTNITKAATVARSTTT